ncbi:Predicted polyphosphate-or ATP-dependent NAD kinase [Dethiosulfatibacter aminovorans DSM 17477]|uniref:Predicted polyphosphate-or ATP-dependent NAD kinase n=1 Tax=Dethiosulfatibacter aminovorans DSM 17477 TaxID=1121476 RepID=A0A1M6F1R3_9FIRM|nr:NAD(+)/NADH kinase [Dethiosulfatibacter aminovorans]SHI91633.1 Predicted polyphosphate-or ATP-dependent NAD kinase [Dethiosulfatibacter aminovorans DSM 17477]
MSTIGIIANPASGKDIRRLVSHATVIDNNEKVNIIERIILGSQKFGVDKIYIMPDSFVMGYKVKEKLMLTDELQVDIEILDMKIKASPKDTEKAAEILEELGVGCVVVIGGDGTNRLAAKHLKTVPLIGVSTGTNNAYPEMLEGTVVGMAAAAVASGRFSFEQSCYRDKIIEIYRNDEFEDIALIDAVISDEIYVGAKAIWDMKHIKHIVVSKCHPASIGFSTLVGAIRRIDDLDDFGGSLRINGGGRKFYAPVAAGTIVEVSTDELEIVEVDKPFRWKADFKGIIAVDGEREVRFHQGDVITFRITRKGPIHVNVKKALEVAQSGGFFLA